MPGEDEKSSSTRNKLQSLNLPWVEKYRPDTLDDLVSHTEIINTIKKFITEDRLPHLLFYGPPGTGKTSTILASARALYPTPTEASSMVLELNASDDRGIGIVRGAILNFASTRTIFKAKPKLIILDEADAMTNDAQNALRRVIEKYTSNVRFCIICNYLGKITPAIQSRCTRFRFGPLTQQQILPRLQHVIQQEKLKVSEDGLRALLRLGEGDMRRVLNILQSTSMAYCHQAGEPGGEPFELDCPHFYTCTGSPLPSDIQQMTNWMLSDDLSTAFNKIHDLKTGNGLALQDILTQVHKFIERIDFPAKVRIYLLKEMADLEYRLAIGTNEKIQLGSLVSIFYTARNMVSSSNE